MLVSKLGRSSKLSPRFLIVSDKAVYFVVSTAKDGRVSTMVERKIPLVIIQGVSMTNLRDDFVALNVNACEEGDPIFTCNFKTEMMCVILTLTGGNMSVNIAPTIDYTRKKDKRAVIKSQKDESVRGDGVYKSHTIMVGSGESPSSGVYILILLDWADIKAVSNPMPPRKPKAAKAAKPAHAGMAVSLPKIGWVMSKSDIRAARQLDP